ncbi:hypothetical protein [Morganella morganii]|uniref:hypothetical protein n=1 Tax=Morganella morganii TaxID=582 RepID=UPI00339C5F39
MLISQTTHNFAKHRGLELTTVNNDGTELLCIWEANNEWEWICSFQPAQEQLVFFGNIYLPQECLNVAPLQGERHGFAVPGLCMPGAPRYTQLHVYPAPCQTPVHHQ